MGVYGQFQALLYNFGNAGYKCHSFESLLLSDAETSAGTSPGAICFCARRSIYVSRETEIL
jgi:hypothetical protein